jgi:hypothetical protein
MPPEDAPCQRPPWGHTPSCSSCGGRAFLLGVPDWVLPICSEKLVDKHVLF